ncbi:hypothetical protein JOE51_004872 [Bradyrhizobium japonicum]|nr:hypothetical protein [Bradyrhizobium japonicum]
MADIEENARRKATGEREIPLSPIAIEVVRRIDALFEIERSINGRSPEGRLEARQTLSRPLVEDVQIYMREQLAKLSRGRFTPARALSSIVRRWRTGWGRQPSTCVRCMSASLASSGNGQSCSPMKRRCRRSIPAAGAPRPVSSGPMLRTTGRGAARARRRRLCLCPRSQSRSTDRSSRRLQGILQVDGYAGYGNLAERGDVQLAFCWSHSKRCFGPTFH